MADLITPEFMERANLAVSLAQLTATPEGQRAAKTPEALGTLLALKKGTDPISLVMYQKRLAGRAEPWGAFISGGPSNPPAAVELLAPPLITEDAMWKRLYDVFSNWLGPWQMHKVIVEGKLPENVVTKGSEALFDKAIKGVGAVTGSALKWIIGGVAVAGVGLVIYHFATRPKPLALREELQASGRLREDESMARAGYYLSR